MLKKKSRNIEKNLLWNSGNQKTTNKSDVDIKKKAGVIYES